MNRLSLTSSPSVSSLSQEPEWHKLPISVKSTDPSQKIGASIAYSVDPAWYVQVRGVAARGGQAILEINKEKFQISIAPKQLAGTTAELFRKALAARGYDVSVGGVEKPTAAELVVLKAQLAVKEQLKRSGRLSELALYHLNFEIELLKSQIDEQGFFTLTATAPK